MVRSAHVVPSQTRRDFLRACVALCAATTASACGVLARVKSTDVLLETPHPDDWHRTLGGIVGVVLPFDHPSFPKVGHADLMAELLRMFPVDGEDYLSFRRALMLFEATHVFAVVPAPIEADERADLGMQRLARGEREARIAEAKRLDTARHVRFEKEFGEAAFSDLGHDAQEAYLRLWGESAFLTRRRFYRGAKALVTVTAYSLRPFWDAVGYEGPLLAERR